MVEFSRLLIVLHVAADMVWIGSILGVAALLLRGASSPEHIKLQGELALTLYRKVANPAFMLAFATGGLRLGLDLKLYLVQTHFMHAKLTFALIVIALHHIIGGRAKKLAKDPAVVTASIRPLSLALLVAATATIYFAVLKPF